MPKQRRSESGKEADERKRNGQPRESRKRKQKTEVSRKEAAAGIETGGRRKEIADERAVLTEKSGPFFISNYNIQV